MMQGKSEKNWNWGRVYVPSLDWNFAVYIFSAINLKSISVNIWAYGKYYNKVQKHLLVWYKEWGISVDRWQTGSIILAFEKIETLYIKKDNGNMSMEKCSKRSQTKGEKTKYKKKKKCHAKQNKIRKYHIEFNGILKFLH